MVSFDQFLGFLFFVGVSYLALFFELKRIFSNLEAYYEHNSSSLNTAFKRIQNLDVLY